MTMVLILRISGRSTTIALALKEAKRLPHGVCVCVCVCVCVRACVREKEIECERKRTIERVEGKETGW